MYQAPAVMLAPDDTAADRRAHRLAMLTWWVIAAGAALRAYHFFAGASMWGDEVALMRNVMRFGAASLPFRTLDADPQIQAAPPLYLWCLKLLYTLFGRD